MGKKEKERSEKTEVDKVYASPLDYVKVPKHTREPNRRLIAPHVDSFNYFLNEGLQKITESLEPVVIEGEVWLENLEIRKPVSRGVEQDVRQVFPSECREGHKTYRGPIFAVVCRQFGTQKVERVENKQLGFMPIMVKTERCNLQKLSPAELVTKHEEHNELGGYFIINGNERLIRLLVLQRRNHVLVFVRPSWAKRGPLYSHYAASMRCVAADQSSRLVTLHYLTDGTATVRFQNRKREFLIPAIIILKALADRTDREIYMAVTNGDTQDTFIADRVELLLRVARSLSLFTRDQCLSYLGSHFRVILGMSASMSDKEVGLELLRRHIFVHLGTDNNAKFDFLILAIRKLYKVVKGDCYPDNADAPATQEIQLPGHVMQLVLKERLEDYLDGIKKVVQKDLRMRSNMDISSAEYFRKAMDRNTVDVTQKMEYFVATGNLRTQNIESMQMAGFTVVAEKLNFLRYMAHFRSVHRGRFFGEIRTTAVRKLLPESWGFLCPVHTPDGAPCGLLNHLASACEVLTADADTSKLPARLVALGMTPIDGPEPLPIGYQPVTLDGRVVGHVASTNLSLFAEKLRFLKVTGDESIPNTLEIALHPVGGNAFPGLFLFGQTARMIRPVIHLSTQEREFIGVMEQVHLTIAVRNKDVMEGVTTHRELKPTAMLSFVAQLTPFSDFNQSPRNMYQCQMGKQSMATPYQTFQYRSDNKSYRLQHLQTPLVRTQSYVEYHVDEYPLGCNAVIAVLSYTGYDMEDAMIINKSSYDRGFMHGSVYKTMVVDLNDYRQSGEPIHHRFCKPSPGTSGFSEEDLAKLDDDGLPMVGELLQKDDIICCWLDDVSGRFKTEKFKNNEPARVESVRVIASEGSEKELQRVSIKLRENRNPVIGDKFSSRHGQKGVLSQLYPSTDMPFTESGMTPDVIINPNAFPSRMTIGMLVEIMAGKAAALHGKFQDGTPFRFNEEHRAVDFMGEQLRAAGFNYHGSEPLYSGIHGTEMRCDIFVGLVYYQRLRHMVKDKYQVRSTGPVNELTQQPIKGRKMGGGIRFGEMERDSMIAHGVSFLLHDRLMRCSDYSQCFVCRQCGSLLSPVTEANQLPTVGHTSCRLCDTARGIEVISVPYVFRYLVNELAAMNVRSSIDVA